MRFKFLFLSFIFTPIFLSACGNVGGINLSHYQDEHATPHEFIVCHGYGCKEKSFIGFNNHEWKTIQELFKKPAKDAKEERTQISQAIALMEGYAQPLIGEHEDQAKAPIVRNALEEMDCIDETINTTQYIEFLQEADLLKFHTLNYPVFKGFIFNGVYPHNSASIIEIATGDIYAVDSYIHKGGEEPNIRLLDNWLKYSADEIQKSENLNQVILEKAP